MHTGVEVHIVVILFRLSLGTSLTLGECCLLLVKMLVYRAIFGLSPCDVAAISKNSFMVYF